ncbi:Short-chain dehydrogenase/reductase SDR [Penicillium chermesinum]|uniref:Short-chain dehydrogenase/reductase SDR n=1 Tax=Penicillium chermesinum TaxID=63820 RepID=A0A9W9TEI8_9EURO|nr:Short-chain dehydrogenase/reductase SDR [Penicillium chermesinum]KAJ5219738.1 Short-chain dehydrogenase/reductase SDR [Penicillium chermesinum]
MELDVTAPEDVLKKKAEEVDAAFFAEYDEAFLTKALRNNALGPLNLTRAFLPSMRARSSGTILFISTYGVNFGSPGASPYLASKGLLEALVPCLASEVQPFGIRTCLVQPGLFRTKVFTSGNVQYRAPNKLPEYAAMNKLVKDGCSTMDGAQSGDPQKAAQTIFEAVRGEGRCAGRELPDRLPLGEDAVQTFRDSSLAKVKIADEWESISSSTGY